VAGRYKVELEDFRVVELPLYEPSGTGDHCFTLVRKRGMSTLHAIEALAAAVGRRSRDVGYAGLKDAHAVAEQWLSFEGVEEAALRAVSIPGLEVLEVRRHGNKLKMGHLRGNRFAILLRGVPADAVEALRANLLHLGQVGVPNYFGEQRFGKRGANLDKGLALLRGGARRAQRRLPRPLLRLLVSAVQSEVFNRVLTRRIGAIDRLLDGDVALLHRNGACFVVEQAALEQPRCAAFEISPTGPLPGPRCLPARGEPGRIEAEAMEALGLEAAAFGGLPTESNAGARRPLRLQVREAAVEEESAGISLAFTLDRGGYATAVLRELLSETPWFGAD
jgi:tRNA pseudouridine13 synthase